MYDEIDPQWTKLPDKSGYPTYFDNTRGQFILDYAEGQLLSSETWEGLTARMDAADKRREKAAKAKLEPFTVHYIPESHRYDCHEVIAMEPAQVTGFHGATGHPMVKKGDKPAAQDSWSRGRYFKDMTPEVIAEWKALKREERRVDRNLKDFVDRHVIEDLKVYANRVWGLKED